MPYSFDDPIDRRHSDSTKWHVYGPDVLPLWTADMDFRVPEPVVAALRARAEHGVFGYCYEPPELREVIVERLARLYGWRVEAGSDRPPNRRARGIHEGVPRGGDRGRRRARAAAGVPAHLRRAGAQRLDSPGGAAGDGAGWRAGRSTSTRSRRPRTIGRGCSFSATRTTRWGSRVSAAPTSSASRPSACARDILICSDEIHCDLISTAAATSPIASLDADVARHSITLMAPSKTFNVPGLRCSFAVIPDAELRRHFADESDFSEINNMGLAAALAAYRDGQGWLDQVLAYLQANRDFVVDFVAKELPGIEMVAPEATYLAWMDCRRRASPAARSSSS